MDQCKALYQFFVLRVDGNLNCHSDCWVPRAKLHCQFTEYRVFESWFLSKKFTFFDSGLSFVMTLIIISPCYSVFLTRTYVCWFVEFSASAIMSDEGERSCPLCAEEMDLTDQQLKPCKCGYEVWRYIYFVIRQSSEGFYIICWTSLCCGIFKVI